MKAYKDGNIPQEAITYQEEESRQAFQDGKLLFLRNWPYVYNLATTEGSSKVKDVLGMTALPGQGRPRRLLARRPQRSHQRVLRRTRPRALDFVKFLVEEEQQKFFATQGSLAPVLGDLYDDQELVAKLPYLPVLKTSIENAVPRPVTPFYPAVTKAIQDNAYAALKGEKTVEAGTLRHAEVHRVRRRRISSQPWQPNWARRRSSSRRRAVPGPHAPKGVGEDNKIAEPGQVGFLAPCADHHRAGAS